MDYDDEFTIDQEYLQTCSLRKDLGILLRSLLVSPYDSTTREYPKELWILGVRVDNKTMKETIQEILQMAFSKHPKVVSFLNAEYANIAYKNSEYKAALNKSDLVLPDGIGLRIAGKWLGTPIRQNVNGTNLFPRLCVALKDQELPLFLLGGQPSVLEGITKWVQQNYPWVQIAGTHHGYFTPEAEETIVKQISDSRSRILLVGLGAPQQNLWVIKHLPKLKVGVVLTVGGLFDFYSQRIPRAPTWMQEMGLEWFYRLIQEPKRLWKRYLIGNWIFLLRIIKQKYTRSCTKG
jgi:N-acetylglucosaminyldiphosphoundecaprenol N-acetyl-beta-D-mannosaminyltransferase